MEGQGPRRPCSQCYLAFSTLFPLNLHNTWLHYLSRSTIALLEALKNYLKKFFKYSHMNLNYFIGLRKEHIPRVPSLALFSSTLKNKNELLIFSVVN